MQGIIVLYFMANEADDCRRFYLQVNLADDFDIFNTGFYQGKCGGSFAEDFVRDFLLENVAEDCGIF